MAARAQAVPAPDAAARRAELVLGLGGGLLSVLGPLSVTVLTPAYPQIAAAFSASPAQVAGVATLFFAGFAGAQLVCGLVSDALGRRRTALGFLALFLLASLLSLFATGIEQLLALRLLQGVGAAIGIATARALVRDRFSGVQAARVVNLMYLVLGIGPMLAPVLGSLLAGWAGYRAVLGFLVLYGAGLMLFLLRLPADAAPPRLAALRLRPVCAVYARLLSDHRFLLPAGAIAGVSGVLYGQSALLPGLLMDRLGLNPQGFALVFALVALCHVAGSVSARRWLGRLAPARLVRLAAVGILAGAAGLIAAALAGPSVAGLIGPIALAAFAGAHSYPVLVAATVEPFPQDAGAASAILGCLQMGAGFVVASLGAAWPGAAPLALAGSVLLAGILALTWVANRHDEEEERT